MESGKQLITQLQAEYLVELRKHEDIKKQFELSCKRMERLTLLLQQTDKIRLIRDKKYEQPIQVVVLGE